MPTLDLALLPERVTGALPPVCAVIDVLRATTMITALLDAGCDGVIPAGSVERARVLAADEQALLAGERGGVPPRGFDMGNSPAGVQRAAVAGRLVVLTTTNGTAAIERVRASSAVVALSLTNLDAVACWLKSRKQDTLVVCAGTDGQRSTEDELAGGMLGGLLQGVAGWTLTAHAADACARAEETLRVAGGLEAAVRASPHAVRLGEIGFDDDVRACARRSISTTVPVLDPRRGALVPG